MIEVNLVQLHFLQSSEPIVDPLPSINMINVEDGGVSKGLKKPIDQKQNHATQVGSKEKNQSLERKLTTLAG